MSVSISYAGNSDELSNQVPGSAELIMMTSRLSNGERDHTVIEEQMQFMPLFRRVFWGRAIANYLGKVYH